MESEEGGRRKRSRDRGGEAEVTKKNVREVQHEVSDEVDK